MRNLKNKVAVITGGASGLGLAMAKRFGREGMRIVLADIELERLNAAVADLENLGVAAIGVSCDVSRAEDVENLAHRTLEHFGSVNVVCNNAGVAPSGLIWEHSTKDWEWAFGPNVWGVIHGIRVFTPILLNQKEEGHIVNTASVAGLMSFNGMGLYCTTKHAVVTMTECLHHDLTSVAEHVNCSVLCLPTFLQASPIRNEIDQSTSRTNAQNPRVKWKWKKILKKPLSLGKSQPSKSQIMFSLQFKRSTFTYSHTPK